MCVFCSIIKGDIPTNLVYEDDVVMAILDISQATKGHTLIIPKKHYVNIYDVEEETLKHMIVVSKKIAILLTDKLNADGCNIVSNNNEAAGQAIGHIHFHVIPRYVDDDYYIRGQVHDYDLKEILAQIKK
ncbi:MAG: HIT family protein [Erysipelotrichia bacterium]|nr:HIT family protein [Erysipelotrichia bacterium]